VLCSTTRFWPVKDGAAYGRMTDMQTVRKQRAAGKKGHLEINPTLNIKASFHNAVIQFDFKIEDEGRVVFVINGRNFSHMVQLEMAPEHT